jgi:hypothetical protein
MIVIGSVVGVTVGAQAVFSAPTAVWLPVGCGTWVVPLATLLSVT